MLDEEGIEFCNKLFKLEKEFKKENLSPEERYKQRLEKSRPVLKDFLLWLKEKEKQTLPKSSLGKAISYCLNQWDKLEAFMLEGAEASAIVYSIIETAKANNLNPFYYLIYLFEKLPNIDLDNLLPWSDSIPQECKVPNKE